MSSERRFHLAAALALFLIECAIARFVQDPLLRPYGGDSLAVLLVYCALRVVTPLRATGATLAALAIACGIEVGQYFHLVDRLGLGGYRLARVVLGTGFEWWDFAAYALGAATVPLLEELRRRR